MSHLALARKWRPQRFEDVIGQPGVVQTLKNAIASGRLAQSFIFAGPRGVGKTTTARILARALNCVKGPTAEPCGKCDACVEIAEGRDVDVLEIDGATYTGVDAVREVIVEPLAITPMRDRYKVFIIDEVHRLSKSAFDALLKSIEEPPPHVRFMMATTDLHSVPVTIQSRSQVFELRTLPFAAIRDQLKSVAGREGIQIDDAALSLVARSAEGSMRDALSALDQVLAFTSEGVTAEDVSKVLGLIGRDVQFEIAETVAAEDAAGAFALAGKVVDEGFDPRTVCRELARLMRDLLVVRIDASRLMDPEIAAESERDRLKALAERYSREDLMRAFDLLSRSEWEIKSSTQPRHHFEMALVKWIHLRQLTPLTDLLLGTAGTPGAGAASSGPAPRPPTRPAPSAAPTRPAPSSMSSAKTPGATDPRGGAADPTGRAAGPRAGATEPPAPDREPRSAPAEGPDLKSALMGSLREQNKTFFSMVVAQAQDITQNGDTVVFTFLPVHKGPKAQFEQKRAWVEQLAFAIAGRRINVLAKEAPPVVADPGADRAEAHKAALRARAKAEPEVQAVLDVFGGEIEDVEELK